MRGPDVTEETADNLQFPRSPPDLRLAGLARRQHGVVTVEQLHASGLSAGAIRHRARVGRLHRLHRGVYALAHLAISQPGRYLAAALAVGPDAVVSHQSAAALWGLMGAHPNPIHVTVARKVPSRRGIRVHAARSLDAHDRTRRDGIPMTSIERTLLDLADTMPPDRLRRAVREAYVQRLVTERELQRAVARSRGRRGAARLAAIVDLGPDRTRSELEDRLLALLRANGLSPAVNVVLDGLPRRVEVDFLFAEERLIVEADGASFHDNRLARESDAARQAMLEAAGYRVLRVTWTQVTRHAQETVARVRGALVA